MVSVTLTVANIPGADLSESFLFCHRCWESAWNKLTTATSAASHPSQTCWTISVSCLDRLEMWKVLRSWLGLLPQHVTGMSSILCCSSFILRERIVFAYGFVQNDSTWDLAPPPNTSCTLGMAVSCYWLTESKRNPTVHGNCTAAVYW